MTENLILTRNFLYKWFFIGFLFFITGAIAFIFVKDFGAAMAQNWYGITPDYYFKSVFIFLAYIKIFLFIFILSPALALHWIINSMKKK